MRFSLEVAGGDLIDEFAELAAALDLPSEVIVLIGTGGTSSSSRLSLPLLSFSRWSTSLVASGFLMTAMRI